MVKAGIVFILVIILFSCGKSHEAYNSKASISKFLLEKTNLGIDTSKIVVSMDSVQDNAGDLEIDQDYEWHVKFTFDKEYFKAISQNIRSTPYFGRVKWFENIPSDSWSKIDTSKVKGVWSADASYFKFAEKKGIEAQEDLILSIDTLNGECQFVTIAF